jgi:excisionase family DNA binding protein
MELTLTDAQVALLADQVADRVTERLSRRQSNPADGLLTALEVSEMLGVPRQRVWALARRGEIPVVRLGPRDLRFDRTDVAGWLGRRTSWRPKGQQ